MRKQESQEDLHDIIFMKLYWNLWISAHLPNIVTNPSEASKNATVSTPSSLKGTLSNDYMVSKVSGEHDYGGKIKRCANLHSLEVWYGLRVWLWRWYHGVKFRNGNAPRALPCCLVEARWLDLGSNPPAERDVTSTELRLLVTGQQVPSHTQASHIMGTGKAPGNRRSRRCGPKAAGRVLFILSRPLLLISLPPTLSLPPPCLHVSSTR